MNIIEVEYLGEDYFCRPIFVDQYKNYYGSTETLSPASPEMVMDELTFFGRSFGCEPMGTPVNEKFVLKDGSLK